MQCRNCISCTTAFSTDPSQDMTLQEIPACTIKNATLSHSAADPPGGGGAIAPLDWGQKNFIARPKNTHLQTPFCMPECAKTHLQQSRISKFSGGGPPAPSLQGEGRGREGGEGGEKEGREGTGGEEWGWGGNGRGARHGLSPPRDKLWIRPCPVSMG